MLKTWVEQGVLVALADRAKRNMAYTKAAQAAQSDVQRVAITVSVVWSVSHKFASNAFSPGEIGLLLIKGGVRIAIDRGGPRQVSVPENQNHG
ncbi:MAG: hypothetical protein Q7T00_05750 [Rugosibacter sp.]|nr:hypothetical protein [Rugosibacter sp.]